MAKGKERFGAERRKVEAAIEVAQERHRRELRQQRIQIASQGVLAYKAKRFREALQSFSHYIQILEDWKGVERGQLHPSLFDKIKDAPELLLISGVLWDLVKLYDQMESAEKYKEFRQYMDKYLLFSRGMTYQVLTSDTLRRYINQGKPQHMADFKAAYKSIRVSRCFVATSLEDLTAPDTTARLRRFRDGYLRERGWGRAFIAWYYRHGPHLADAMDRCPRVARRCVARVLDGVASGLRDWT